MWHKQISPTDGQTDGQTGYGNVCRNSHRAVGTL